MLTLYIITDAGTEIAHWTCLASVAPLYFLAFRRAHPYARVVWRRH